ncbi:MAG: antibiotic biosynthesis monooxygenase [Bryobacterales bacterium]|nr:antibiotic biosynthesis monooxygenase [Bryobacterales bacterium]
MDTSADQTLTAIVRRRIKPGAEADFEAMMQEFVAVMIRHPGHLGINMIRPEPGSRDYTVLNRFATQGDRRRFTELPEYRYWMDRLREVSEADPEIEERIGLAFWFTLPGRPARHPPPRPKMALLTLLGVYPLTMLLPRLVLPVTPGWPHWLRALLVASLIVASLTWLIMPNLTRLFEPWLFPEKKG